MTPQTEAGGLRGELALGHPHIGTTAQQVGRNAGHHRG